MRVLFDAGTLVLAEAPDRDLSGMPGVVWDPRVGLWRAPARNYRELLRALSRAGVPFVDQTGQREPLEEAFQRIDLRAYQRASLLAWELEGRRGIVVLPTGAGKTRVALAAMASTRARTLCLVPTRVLVHQWVREIRRVYAGPVGVWGDGQKSLEPVTVATFEGAYRSMHELGRHFDLVVADEVHHFGVAVRDEALEMCLAPYRLGLTATLPGELAQFRLKALIGEVVHELTIDDLAGTYLSDYDLYVLRVVLTPEERRAYELERRIFAEAYRRFSREQPGASWQDFVQAAAQTVEGRNAMLAWHQSRRLLSLTQSKMRMVGSLLDRHRDNKTLVFTSDNAAAYAIARQHLVAPITCEIGQKERDRLLGAFRDGKLRALVSARVLNEGVDVPDADVAIVVGGTHGEREHVQRIGRLLRPLEGKRATVYELVTAATAEGRQSRERRAGLVTTHVARG